jgi:hypothetical protein
MKNIFGVILILFSVLMCFEGFKTVLEGFSNINNAQTAQSSGQAVGYAIGGGLFIVLGIYLIRLSIKKLF